MMYETIEFDLDIDIHPRDAATYSYDPDPLSHPRFDLFQSLPHGWSWHIDVRESAGSRRRASMSSIATSMLNVTASPSSTWVSWTEEIGRSACGCTSAAKGRTGKPEHSWSSSEPAFREGDGDHQGIGGGRRFADLEPRAGFVPALRNSSMR